MGHEPRTRYGERGLVISRASAESYPNRKLDRRTKKALSFFYQKMPCANAPFDELHEVVIGLDEDKVMKYFYSTCQVRGVVTEAVEKLGGLLCSQIADHMTLLAKGKPANGTNAAWGSYESITPSNAIKWSHKEAKTLLALDQATPLIAAGHQRNSVLVRRGNRTYEDELKKYHPVVHGELVEGAGHGPYERSIYQRARARAKTWIEANSRVPLELVPVYETNTYDGHKQWALNLIMKTGVRREEAPNRYYRSRKKYNDVVVQVLVAKRINKVWHYNPNELARACRGAFNNVGNSSTQCVVCACSIKSKTHHRTTQHVENTCSMILEILKKVPGTRGLRKTNIKFVTEPTSQ